MCCCAAFDQAALQSEILYDGLGRESETRQYESGGAYISATTSYDALGRVAATTTYTYDALGRITSITTPDNAVTRTSYSGNQSTITDPAGNSRSLTYNAWGELTLAADATGATTYSYDASGNLRTVTQGSQRRTFTYHSLGLLVSAANPESGT